MVIICDICNKDFHSLSKLNRHKNSKKSCKDKLIIKYNLELLEAIETRDNCIINKNEINIDKLNCRTIIHFKCNCGEIGNKQFISLYQGKSLCKKCIKKIQKEKLKKTCLDKYGVENTFQLEEIKNKIKNTNFKKFGVEYPNIKGIIRYDKDLLIDICKRDNCIINFDKIDKYNSKIEIQFICECGKHYQKIFTMMYKVGAICDNCTNMLKETKKKTTCLEKYGVENPLQSQEVKDKLKQTCLKKYGVEHPLQSQQVKDKSKEYFIKTYGVENASQVQENKDKKEQKAIEIYGVKNISQSNIIKNKKVEKSLNKYGTEYVLQSQEIREKSKQCCLNKYGVEYPMQNAEFYEKQSKNSYKLKKFAFPCGNTITVQGYEPFLLKILVELNHTFNDIITKRTDVPEIWYEKNDKKHRYYCDAYIKETNTIYEVKSTWTYKKDIEDIPLKRQACIDRGYLFELFVFDSKGIKQSV
jgi:hypothetical protein